MEHRVKFGLIKLAGLVWLALYLYISLLCPSELAIIFSSLISCVAQHLLPSVTGYHPRGYSTSPSSGTSAAKHPFSKARSPPAKPDHFHARRAGAAFPFPFPGLWGSPSPCARGVKLAPQFHWEKWLCCMGKSRLPGHPCSGVPAQGWHFPCPIPWAGPQTRLAAAAAWSLWHSICWMQSAKGGKGLLHARKALVYAGI